MLTLKMGALVSRVHRRIQKLRCFVSREGSHTHRSVALSALAMIGLVLIAAQVPAFADPMNCTLILPKNPLTATGLSTPFLLATTDGGTGVNACDETNGVSGAFVGGAIIDTDTGKISVYNPLVINQGTSPAIAPVLPVLPKHYVAALWFGFDGNNLILQGTNPGDLKASNCVNGDATSLFSQYSYCNAVAFFKAANLAIAEHKMYIPPLGISPMDHNTCPSVRDFRIVDQDPNDNLPTSYLVVGSGPTATLAQDTTANRLALPTASVIHNPSDELLLAVLWDPLIGCHAWMQADLADPGHELPSLPTNELQAAMFQTAPVAHVPANDPMTTDPELTIGAYDLDKTNLYRAGVDQPAAHSIADADPITYCKDFRAIAPGNLISVDQTFLAGGGSPNPAAANSLFTFLALRYVTSYQLLNCAALLDKPVNMSLTMTGGIVTGAACASGTNAVTCQ
jgi:hypothetical protein